MNDQQARARAARISRIYVTIPGAPFPPIIDGWYAWGDVEGNDQWVFAEAIINAIDAAVVEAKGGAE